MCEQCRYSKIEVVRDRLVQARRDQIEALLRAILAPKGEDGL